MKDKAFFLVLKVLGLAISIFIFALLLPMCDTISDRWFTIWLWGTILSGISIVFFTFWVIESIVHKEQSN